MKRFEGVVCKTAKEGSCVVSYTLHIMSSISKLIISCHLKTPPFIYQRHLSFPFIFIHHYFFLNNFSPLHSISFYDQLHNPHLPPFCSLYKSSFNFTPLLPFFVRTIQVLKNKQTNKYKLSFFLFFF